MTKTFKGDDIKGKNLSKQDLSGAIFEQCDLSGTSFFESNLSGAQFIRCVGAPNCFTHFEKATMTGVIMQGCRFENANLDDANLHGAKLRNTTFYGAHARNSHWDESRLDDVNFAMVDFDLASFRNVKVLRVQFKPAITTGTRHFLRLLKQNKTSKRTIFTSGTELSPFIAYCTREYRLSLLLLEIESLSLMKKLPRVVFATLIGLVSDFGHSLSRWLMSAGVIVSVFAAYFYTFKHAAFPTMSSAWHHALLHFINQGTFSLASNGPVQTLLNVLGYFMLGMLISIITNRFVSRW